MAEVSETPQEVVAETKSESQSAVAKEVAAPQHPEKKFSQQDIKELDAIREELSSLLSLCDETLSVCGDLSEQETVQRQLRAYSSGLVTLAVALQHLNDFRRLISSIVERAQIVRQALISARGGEEDALVSEEARVLSACEQAKETVIQSIQSLEYILSQVRDTSAPLLAVVSYTAPGFEEFSARALSAVRIDLVASGVFSERERLRGLRQDIHDVYVLEEHARSLQ